MVVRCAISNCAVNRGTVAMDTLGSVYIRREKNGCAQRKWVWVCGCQVCCANKLCTHAPSTVAPPRPPGSPAPALSGVASGDNAAACSDTGDKIRKCARVCGCCQGPAYSASCHCARPI